jgi:hypothetical protein
MVRRIAAKEGFAGEHTMQTWNSNHGSALFRDEDPAHYGVG